MSPLPAAKAAPAPTAPAAVRPSARRGPAGAARAKPSAPWQAPSVTDIHAAMERLGLPRGLWPAQCPADRLEDALAESLERLPTASVPSGEDGTVVAVIGPAALAVAAAGRLAKDLGVPAESVLLACSYDAPPVLPEDRVLRGVGAAGAASESWTGRTPAVIVAVDAPLTAAGAVAAREFAEALEPTCSWAVVEASRKTRDVAAWTRSIGGVDALAVVGCRDTSDPAAVLSLPVPVARLDGKEATPRAWARLLASRAQD